MSIHVCNFTIPSGTKGGKLGGDFADASKVMSGDDIVVIVDFPSVPGPANLTGTFVFSAAGTANQDFGTPFVATPGGKFVCIKSTSVAGVVLGLKTRYMFPAMSYGGGAKGKYELTFVVADNVTNPQLPVQWSKDPEFETGN